MRFLDVLEDVGLDVTGRLVGRLVDGGGVTGRLVGRLVDGGEVLLCLPDL